MVISKTETRKFIIALLVYIITITTITFLPLSVRVEFKNQGQNQQLQGKHIQGEQLPIPVYHRPDRELIEQIEPSRGEAVRAKESISGRELTLQATAYTWTGDKTATGPWPKQGVTIAVNPQIIPFHSKVFIEGVGWRTAEDRIPESSIRKGASIDIYMDSEADCWRWGRRNVKVVIIPPREDLKNN